MTIDQMVQGCVEGIQEQFRHLKALNILVAGKTGVGKSTLINAMFRENLAETGIGAPVTQKIRKYTKPELPLCIYDTKGFELNPTAQEEVQEEIFSLIKKGQQNGNINEAIHCIWYCINSASDRLEEEEISWLRTFTEENQLTQVPVIVVLTKAFSRKQSESFKSYIDALNLNVIQVVPVLAQDYIIDDDMPPIKARGLDTLVEIMDSVLSEELKKTFMNVQKASIKEKVRHARGVVATATTAAVAAAAVPVPLADAALLIPSQVTMIAGISVVFGLEPDRALLTTFVSSALGCSGATLAGKGIANFLKAIPGVGTVLGGIISAGTASVLTAALGEAYIQLMVLIAQGELKAEDLSTAKGKEVFENLYRHR